MRRGLLRVVVFSFASLTGSLASAGVRVVDASGGGSFTQISAAVAAASDGDVLLVKSGSYAPFTISAKALDVVADTGANVVVQGSVSISSLAAARTVTLTGLRIEGTFAALTGALRLSGCSGSIRVQGCVIDGFDQPGCNAASQHGGVGVDVAACADVAFADCVIRGGKGGDVGWTLLAGNGGEAFRGTSSMIALHDCAVSGGHGGVETPGCGTPAFSIYGGDGGNGLSVGNLSSLFVANSAVTGGNFGDLVSGYEGCSGSALVIAGFPATTVRSLQSSYLAGDPSLQCGPGSPPNVVIAFPSTHTTLAPFARRIEATSVVREQQTAQVDFYGQPGDRVQLVIGEAPRFVYSSAWRGVSLVRRPHPSPVQLVGTIPASGVLTQTWTVPDLGAGVQSRRLLLQAEFLDLGRSKTVSSPATIVLVDSAF